MPRARTPPPPEPYALPEPLARTLAHGLRVLVAGVGGNGSKLLTGLKSLDLALRHTGRSRGLAVSVYDGDTVSPSNLARQNFFPADLGHNKAEVLVHRVNLACGLGWRAVGRHLGADDLLREAPQLVVSCLDSRRGRAEVWAGVRRRECLWLDLGNGERYGQAILGESPALRGRRLPCAPELHPEIADGRAEDDAPSCSVAESLRRQDLFVNDLAAVWGLNLLWALLYHGGLTHHGVYFDLERGESRPLPVPPAPGRGRGRGSRRS